MNVRSDKVHYINNEGDLIISTLGSLTGTWYEAYGKTGNQWAKKSFLELCHIPSPDHASSYYDRNFKLIPFERVLEMLFPDLL